MSLKFCNNYGTELWVTVMWYRPGCPDGGDWEKAGWWHLNPGECKTVLGFDLNEVNRNYLYEAEAGDGAVWAGQYVRPVPNTAFDWCEWTSSTQARNVGYRLFDVGDVDDFTVNLAHG